MEIAELRDQLETTTELVELSKQYADARKKAAEAKINIDIMLTAKLANIREQKSNVGYDMAILMLMEEQPHVKEDYTVWKREEAKYKGLEKIIDSLRTKLSFYQTIAKYTIEQGG